jgi:cbb3-type cytochrome oxidase maturation protein
MEVIYLLIFMSSIIAVGFLIAFFLSVRDGQYEDSQTPAIRMLFEDMKPRQSEDESE